MAVDVDVFVPVRTPLRSTWTLADGAYLIFLLLVFVGVAPFATRDPIALAAGERGSGAAGDLVRQVAYAGAFLLIALTALRVNGVRALSCLSPTLAALLAWCAVSAAWAPVPDVAFRRAILELIIVLCAAMSVATLGAERSFIVLRGVLVFLLLVNWFSIPLIRNAVHLPGEIDPGLVGDWRGLYFHKNLAGSVSAITAIIFFFQALKTRPLVNGTICAAAIAFAVMTRSKSSLAFLPLAIAAACMYRFAWRRGIDRAILSTAILIAAILGVVVLLMDWGQISHALNDPAELTGRTAIWRGEIAFIRDHLLFGAGYGSFADTGAVSLLHNYVADRWVQNISHGHNGYLQLLVTIGATGFALAMMAFVAAPAREFWRFDPAGLQNKAALFGIFVFEILHNLLESDFLAGDDPPWPVFLVVLAMLRFQMHVRNRTREVRS